MADLENVVTPNISEDVPEEVRNLFKIGFDHIIDVVSKWNSGRPKIRGFTSAAILNDMAVGEIAYRTNGDLYVKTSSTVISVYTRDSTIT